MNNKILVSIAMPNEKDLEVMNESIETLGSFGVPYEVTVISAHRSPGQMIEYAKNVKDRGIEVIIATASGAAHLPGMIAAFSILPVIAVPLRSSVLDGLDSVLSMLQMPSGVPVATVSVNGARNAAILPRKNSACLSFFASFFHIRYKRLYFFHHRPFINF
jgi:5-(carboxyamino)imidazole ribonucleotide mutase